MIKYLKSKWEHDKKPTGEYFARHSIDTSKKRAMHRHKHEIIIINLNK